MLAILRQYFLPHRGNNHRSKLLHHTSLLIIGILFLLLTLGVIQVHRARPEVLGISYSVTSSQLLDLTNKVRAEQNLKPLTLNEELSRAAAQKAKHMFTNNYWAHFAPDGTTPWSFIKAVGYNYSFAGENLAKGFSNSSDVVTAWMNSPTHRDNLLSAKYTDVGFAVVEGDLLSEDTVLVVQMFGAPTATSFSQVRSESSAVKELSNAAVPEAGQKNSIENYSYNQQNIPEVKPNAIPQSTVIATPAVNILSATKSITIILASFLIAALLFDFIIIERKRIPRIVGHNIDHIVLITLFLIFIILARNGVTL